MDIKTLLGYSTEDLERMSDEELEKLLSPYFKVTRPESGRVAAPATRSGPARSKETMNSNAYALAKAKKLIAEVKDLTKNFEQSN